MISRIGRFMSAHPALHVDLRMADDRQYLIVEGVDVAFRFGQSKGPKATSTMLGRCAQILVAPSTVWPRWERWSSRTVWPTIRSSWGHWVPGPPGWPSARLLPVLRTN
ncbi:hypothetical protein AB6809_35325 [Paraburkholderia sp. RCC_158]|uniref:hypothetical protein n=1 Tax=Paraburkholderia sp. RCC_158 TaxID=3239220 RepID=UPI003526B3E0